MAQPIPSEETVDNDLRNHAQSQEERHLLHSMNSAIAIRQVPSEGIAFQLWPAAATLVSLLDRQPTSLSSLFAAPGRPLRLLELGSGTGLVGIAAAALLGASVTVTDLPHVLPNLQFNVDANAGILGVRGGAVDVAALSWGDRQEMEGIGRDYDVVLGSDVVYHDHLYEPLIETLRFFLGKPYIIPDFDNIELPEPDFYFISAYIRINPHAESPIIYQNRHQNRK